MGYESILQRLDLQQTFCIEFHRSIFETPENWPNTDIQYGPLTLMQGWIPITTEDIQKEVYRMIQNFLKGSPVIDTVLDQYKIR